MSAFKNLKLANDVMNFAQQLPFDYLLEDLLKCKNELEFAEYCMFLKSIDLENPQVYISDLSVWDRAVLVRDAKKKYNL